MKFKLAVLFCLLTSLAFAGDFVIYPNGISTNTTVGTSCPNGTFPWECTYAKNRTNGWGWAPDTNNFTSFTATYTSNSLVTVQTTGKNLDTYCGIGSVTITNPPPSTVYRFTVYGPKGTTPPSSTNAAPLTLHGFLGP